MPQPCSGSVGRDVAKQPPIPLISDGGSDDVVDGGDCFTSATMSDEASPPLRPVVERHERLARAIGDNYSGAIHVTSTLILSPFCPCVRVGRASAHGIQ
jgi:hypothetical protein